MAEPERTYGTIVTDRGTLLITAAVMSGTKVNLTTLAVGDGGGAYYQPTPSMTALKNQVWSGNVKSVSVNEKSPNMVDVVAVIPSDVGGWTIREMGVIDDTGNLIAICNTPDTEKVVISSGAAGEIELTMHLEISNTASVTMVIDPHVVVATKQDLTDHDESENAHAGTFVKTNEKAAPNGVATLNADGLVSAGQRAIKDDATGKLFSLGVENGKLYFMEVSE